MKKLVVVIPFVIGAVCLDSLLSYLGIPIVTMDLILVPLSIALVVWVFSPTYLSGEYINWHQTQSGNTYTKFGVVSVMFVLFLLSVFMIYVGFSKPLGLYIGVRGGGHGYSISILGLAMLLFLFSTMYVYLAKKCITKSSTRTQ